MNPRAHPPLWRRELSIAAGLQTARERPMALALGLGIALRLIEYLHDRGLWLDEASLVGCIGQIDQVGLFGPLGATQLAPPGFLALEWLATHLLGSTPGVYRLVPLAAGIATLFLAKALAQRILTARGALFAVIFFALTDDLIYYSTEVKQYATDLAFTLLVVLAAGRVDDSQAPDRRWFRLLGLGLLGLVLVWWSHPLAFTLAAVGVVGFLSALRCHDRRAILTWVGVGAGWLGSILAVRAVGLHQLAYRGDMWAFWEFAFPPRSITTVWDASWPLRRVLFLFASPLNFDWPLGPRWSVLPAVALTLVGAGRLARSQPRWLTRLVLPGGFALGAACGRIYPFHGRLLLFWVPLLLVLIAAGLDGIARCWLRWALTGWLLGGLGWTAVGSVLGPRDRVGLNPYGDRRPATLNASWYPLLAPTLDPPTKAQR